VVGKEVWQDKVLVLSSRLCYNDFQLQKD
jgi:hypothetical protein